MLKDFARSISVALLLALALPAFAGRGTESSGGGGGFLESRFMEVARKSAMDLNANSITWTYGRPFPYLKLSEFFPWSASETPKARVVITSQPLILNGSEKSAITSGNTITLYKPDWQSINDPKQFRHLVLHELMRLVDVPDDHYEASKALEVALEQMDAFEASPSSDLRKITMVRNSAYMCHGVIVFCGPGQAPQSWLNAVAELDPNHIYAGKCYDALLYCPK